MARVMSDFVEVLNECNAIQETKTANLLLDLAKGNVEAEHLLDGDIPMFINKSITEIGKISYATKNRIEYNSWTDAQASDLENRQRVKAKVGRALGKIFYASFLESHFDGKMANDVEVFTSQLKSKFIDVNDNHFNLSAPFGHYHYDYTHPDAQDGCGTLGDSCMRHDECVNDGYFDLYDHPNTPVQLVTYDEGDGIQSRALLWSLPEGKFLDRIYETHDGDMDMLKDLAVRKGWIFKQRQSYSNKIGWVKGGDNTDIPLIIPVAHWDECSNFPYIDTFTYGFEIDGDCYLTNDRKYAWSKLGVKKFRAYECTGGGYQNQNVTEVYRVCSKEFTTRKDISFGESTYSLREDNTRYSNVLNPTGDDWWEFAQYDDSGNTAIIRWRDEEGGSQYFHISECRKCDYSLNRYPNHPEVNVHMKRITYGRGQEGFVNMEYFVKDFKGRWQPKSECAVFIDKNGVAKVINTNIGGRVVKDIFGVNRLQSECVVVDGNRIEGYVHNKEVLIIKMLNKRIEDSVGLRNITDQVRCELNI